MDEPETQVRLEVVEATMSSPIFRAEPVEPAVVAPLLPETSDLPPVAAALRGGLELDLAVVAALAVAASFFAGDARVAVVAGSLGFLAVGFRRIDRRVPFSFGGLLGYRADLGWPRGVQEDDDVHWNWNGGAPDAVTARRDTARAIIAEP